MVKLWSWQWFFATLLFRHSVTKKVVKKSGCKSGFFASCLFRYGSRKKEVRQNIR
ncbi:MULTISPECIES: hypothetical protein [Bacteroidales]|uniref:hypothetical protein n=1 Tax=Bacteroidales TaxID=171549 RepID=UPI001DE2C852|nr:MULTISPECIES: hypothetical protein [Bacteroidales]MBS6576936.1 hypothetical protein [Parabacteroides goldsteinii]MCZ2565918.1 hypothetical protein [Bacteroides fragilis]